MLSSIVIDNYSRLGGLGGYTEAEPSPAPCRPNDFRCGVRGGIHSCRPCDRPQLAAFADFQHLLNRLIEIKGIDPRFKIPVDEDGRIGPRTATTAGTVAAAIMAQVPPDAAVAGALQAAISVPKAPETHRQLALVIPELLAYLGRAAEQLNAPEVPRRDPPPAAIALPTDLKPIKAGGSKAFAIAGVLLAAGAIGLAVAGARKQKQKKGGTR